MPDKEEWISVLQSQDYYRKISSQLDAIIADKMQRAEAGNADEKKACQLIIDQFDQALTYYAGILAAGKKPSPDDAVKVGDSLRNAIPNPALCKDISFNLFMTAKEAFKTKRCDINPSAF